jgi:carbamate kinase
VIDKDLASSLLARSIGADLFVLATGVERVAVGFNTPAQRWLDRMTLEEARRYDAADEFDKGSMGPKIKALIEFLDGGGSRGLITASGSLCRALAGETGTVVVP